MRHGKFNRVLNRRIELTKSVLASKNKEYASSSDKLHNFKRAGRMLGCTPEKALIGMWTKHIISLLDIVDEIEYKCNGEPDCLPVFEDDTEEYIGTIEEKIGDAINYLILLEAMIKERYEK